jgi:hypothetical protein
MLIMMLFGTSELHQKFSVEFGFRYHRSYMITTPLHDVRIEGNKFPIKASSHKSLVRDIKYSYYFDIQRLKHSLMRSILNKLQCMMYK